MDEPTLESKPIIIAKEQPTFVRTPYIDDIIKWAMIYLEAGFPVHFRGPSGTGKTTIALYIAAQLGRPVILIHGDEEIGTANLIGEQQGYRRKKMVDNFIHSVLKAEEFMTKDWMDNRLTVACKNGFTLIYDEFTRSRPEANNALLSVLEEKILDLPSARGEDNHLKVHPDFSAIFTSNPEEYAGVYKAQDALKDRMITINLDHFDQETEIAIAETKSGLPREEVEKIVKVVREFRKNKEFKATSTVRASVMIAKVLNLCQATADKNDPNFLRAANDILVPESNTGNSAEKVNQLILNLIKKYC